MFPIIVSYSTLGVGPSRFILQKERYCSLSTQENKKIGHHTPLRENDDLPVLRYKEQARALITRKSIRGNDARRDTGE